jgi:hypothetical protein
MSKVIYDLHTKEYISIRTALNRGIVKDVKRFKLPPNRVLIPKGKTKELITFFQASKLIKEGKLRINMIIGDFDACDTTYKKKTIGVVCKNALPIREQNKIRKENTDIIRYVLTKEDRYNPYAVYDFIKKK